MREDKIMKEAVKSNIDNIKKAAKSTGNAFKEGAKKVTDVTNNKVVKPVKEFNETAGGSMLIGGTIGTLSGAGVGGIGAAAAGGDEDDVKAAIATGAMIGGGAGVIGGAIRGGVKLKAKNEAAKNEAAKVAEKISKAGADGKPVS